MLRLERAVETTIGEEIICDSIVGHSNACNHSIRLKGEKKFVHGMTNNRLYIMKSEWIN